jgi:hypothetical protein
MRLLIVLILMVGLIGLVGCSSEVKLKSAPVSMSGKALRGGQPVSGMVMIFQPLGDGHVREFPINRDGSFKGEVISGEYAYYVAKRPVPSAAPAPIKLSPKYFEADLSRTVTVEPDKLLAIVLD